MVRGAAYKCGECPEIDEHQRLLLHFYRRHRNPIQAPYYCLLCNYRTAGKKGQEDLDRHVRTYKIHGLRRRQLELVGKIRPDADYLVANDTPYVVTQLDLMKFGRAASAAHWEKVEASKKAQLAGPPYQPTPITMPVALQPLVLQPPALSAPVIRHGVAAPPRTVTLGPVHTVQAGPLMPTPLVARSGRAEIPAATSTITSPPDVTYDEVPSLAETLDTLETLVATLPPSRPEAGSQGFLRQASVGAARVTPRATDPLQLDT
jgi:hypothetical protein